MTVRLPEDNEIRTAEPGGQLIIEIHCDEDSAVGTAVGAQAHSVCFIEEYLEYEAARSMRPPQERAALNTGIARVVVGEPSHRVGECQQLDNRRFRWLHHRDELIKPAENGTDGPCHYPARQVCPAAISPVAGD
jgi:hypothetical protein